MVLDFGLLSSNLFPSSNVSGQGMGANTDTVIWNDVGIGIVPIGSIIAWAKSITGAPPLLPNFVQCDGQTLSDGDSPLNGQVIPDLNGGNKFLRGASTSGGTGGKSTINFGIGVVDNATGANVRLGNMDDETSSGNHTMDNKPVSRRIYLSQLKSQKGDIYI